MFFLGGCLVLGGWDVAQNRVTQQELDDSLPGNRRKSVVQVLNIGQELDQ